MDSDVWGTDALVCLYTPRFSGLGRFGWNSAKLGWLSAPFTGVIDGITVGSSMCAEEMRGVAFICTLRPLGQPMENTSCCIRLETDGALEEILLPNSGLVVVYTPSTGATCRWMGTAAMTGTFSNDIRLVLHNKTVEDRFGVTLRSERIVIGVTDLSCIGVGVGTRCCPSSPPASPTRKGTYSVASLGLLALVGAATWEALSKSRVVDSGCASIFWCSCAT